MQQFLIIALAHFLALLSPGPDFFLVARTSISSGWRIASGACLGIALANGAFIAMAFTGLSVLQEGSLLFTTLQLAGASYLLYIGVLFLRHAGQNPLGAVAGKQAGQGWWRGLGMGFVSGILNPKNALFYASLASMVASASDSWKAAYALWMFSIVLLWDLLVAVAIGNQRVLRRFARSLPCLERASGVMLVLLAAVLMLHLARG
ncbi:threonine transporter RhtB [Pseudomonas putida]|uniref:Threonine transporter RhtB n=1 Tax=Pseudomonas putida TaxID=303 RepID=A0AA37REZ2_PSEPU|nr:LysE family translocator [Pseudomonas putida]GLO12253.1 threonine transporter RhtB [Pseudomonas putida]GLO35364.1 threonine transporter RhtB [Pseudomonas putida]HDS0962964.1 LysE family translocator [Pseudomonas putida]HDS0990198.1 LysE family translocator [Pseudomonas putida]